MIYKGTVHLFGDNVDTDVMIAGRHLSLLDPREMAKHMFEESDPGFVKRVKPGDIMVAGHNFGSGSAREHAPLGFQALGISCIVAESFSRTFYRMAVDLGLPIIECAEAAKVATQGAEGRVDTGTGEIVIGNQRVNTEPLPPFVQEIIDAGGMTNWVMREARERGIEMTG
jgi:3-isopropylmalate/(R)-2-methylmalate dehydratase small subunit